MKNTPNKIKISVRLDKLNHEVVMLIAARYGMSFSDALNEALNQWRVSRLMKGMKK